MEGYNTIASELQLQNCYHSNSFWFHEKLSGGIPRNIRVLKKCRKFTGEHPCRSVISIATLLKARFGTGVNLLHIFRTLFSKNTSRRLLL